MRRSEAIASRYRKTGGSTYTELVASHPDTSYSHVGLSAGSTRHYKVYASNLAGNGDASNVASARTSVSREEDALPQEVWLSRNYPNPFTSQTTIRYILPAAGDVRLVVYDVLGVEIATLVDGVLAARVVRSAIQRERSSKRPVSVPVRDDRASDRAHDDAGKVAYLV